jgi:hypothetical protein
MNTDAEDSYPCRSAESVVEKSASANRSSTDGADGHRWENSIQRSSFSSFFFVQNYPLRLRRLCVRHFFNHGSQVCGQSRDKLDLFDLGVDEGLAVFEAEGFEAGFADHRGEFEQFGVEVFAGFFQRGVMAFEQVPDRDG